MTNCPFGVKVKYFSNQIKVCGFYCADQNRLLCQDSLSKPVVFEEDFYISKSDFKHIHKYVFGGALLTWLTNNCCDVFTLSPLF